MLKKLVFLFINIFIFSTLINAEDPSPTPTPLGFDDISSYYYDLPAEYNMPSCEKVVKGGGDDVLKSKLPLYRCKNGKSDGNPNIVCDKDWIGAYAEVATIKDFPMLKFLSAASASGTEANPITPLCYYDIQANTSDSKGGSNTLNFSNDYPGLLMLSNPDTKKFANIKYKHLGPFIHCGVVEWRTYKDDLRLDIMGFENLPSTSDQLVSGIDGEKGDNLFTFIINVIKHFNIFELSLKSREADNIKDVADELKKFNIKDRETVCNDLTVPINKVNVSDNQTQESDRENIVVNDGEEMLNYTHSELCDKQYFSGDIEGATCTLEDGTEFPPSIGGSLESLGFVTFGFIGGQLDCIESISICGETHSCETTGTEAYRDCRSKGLEVESVDGNPIQRLSLEGFKELVLPGGNKAVENTVETLEQINSPSAIKYGENWGIKIQVSRTTYDLNSRNKEYTPIKGDDANKDPDLVESNFNSFIAYKKIDYNSNYVNSFQKISGDSEVQYYFPFIGRIPYLLERLSTIHSNALDPETAYKLTKQNYIVPSGTSMAQKSNVLGLSTEKETEVQKPQIFYCEDLTPEEAATQDCYGDRIGDPVKNYLCSFGIGDNCNECSPISKPTTSVNPSVTPTYPPGIIGGGKIMNTMVLSPYDPGSNGFRITSSGIHPGTDFGIVTGTDIRAIADGVVIFVREDVTYNCNFVDNKCGVYNQPPYNGYDAYGTNTWWGGYGNVVGIMHEDGVSVYAHLQTNTVSVNVGDQVLMGQVFAKSDNTGNSTGSHLHFEMRKLNCPSYNASCTVNNSDISMFGAVNGVNTTQVLGLMSQAPESITPTPAGAGIDMTSNNIDYCSSVKQVNDTNPSTTPNPDYNGECLFVVAANAINAIEERIAPEVIYAIAKKETGFNCSEEWESWLAGGYIECTGDPRQLAFRTKNGVAWEGRINIGLCPVDVRGFTQFSASANGSLSCADAFNSITQNHSVEMRACLDAMGVSEDATGNAFDELADTAEFSRHRVGDTICATAILMANYGKISKGSYLTADEWRDLNGIGGQALEYAAGRYHGNCSLNYCTTTRTYMEDVMNSDILNSKNCLQ